MSEFKYACPVCGQHMVCDSSQSGSVMECPTCFQKIVAPQAPTTDDPKFILTGTKYSEKKIPDTLARAAAAGVVQEKSGVPVIIALVLFVLLAAGAAFFVFHNKLLGTGGAANASTSNAANPTAQTPVPAAPKKTEKPPAVAPPSSDANWMLALDNATNLPASPVAGRIHGQDFIMERAYFQNGILTLRNGTHGPVDFGCSINFSGAQAESLSGHTIDVASNVDTAARIVLHWKNDTASGKDNFDGGYAMRLEFGPLANNHLPGKIYLCTPDAEKSYLMGTFNADARKPKPKKQ